MKNKLISIILSFTIILAFMPIINVSAEESSGTCGNDLTWTLDDSGTLTISGTGEMTRWASYSKVPWYSIRENITNVVMENGVTSIGNYTFYNCSNLTSVTIPDSVTSIGDLAFYDCSSLTNVYITDLAAYLNIDFDGYYSSPFWANSNNSHKLYINGKLATDITIPNSVARIPDCAFLYCSSLISVTISDSVTSIGDRAFSECSGLTSITIPDGVTRIGEYAFYCCSSLTSITIPDGVTRIGNWTFGGCSSLKSITIPDGVTSIGNCAFHSCSRLTDITIPDSVTSIGGGAFNGCSRLTDITIPDGVTSIGDETFSECIRLTSITIPDGVTSIGVCTFYNCSSLTSITIPDGVTSIGEGAFSNCSGLTSITIPDGVTSIGDGTFESCSSLTSITIPDGVTSIGDCAFGGCSSLTSITIPDGVTSIGGSAFSGCSGLTSITIPDGVTSIGDGTFSGCSGFTSIEIPSNVDYIGNYAFNYCYNLKSIVIPDKVEIIGDNAFCWCEDLSGIYYKGTEEQWAAIDIGKENDILKTATIYYVTDMGRCGNNLNWILFANGTLSLNSNGNVSEWSGITELPWSKYENSITDIEFDGSRNQWAEYFKDSVSSAITLHTVENMADMVTADNSKTFYYTGEAINASFDIKDGDVLLSEGEDYIIESYENNINAGTATAILKGCDKENEQTNAKYTGIKTVTFEINKSEAYVDTEASCKDSLFYTGEPQELIKQGKTNSGILVYSLDENGEYSPEIPVGTEAGEYTVFYKVIGDGNHFDSATYSVNSKIVKINPDILTLPTAKKELVYSGETQELIDGGETTDGTLQYSLDENGEYSPEIPVGTEAKEYTVFYKVVGDNNHEDSEVYRLTAKIGKAEPSLTANPSAKEGLIYNKTAQELVNDGEAQNGTLQYSLDKSGKYSTDIPTATNAGEYTVFYKIAGDANYSDSEISELTVEIGKAKPEFDLPSGLTALFGKTLDDIQLPKGFAWAEGSTRLNEVGVAEFDAIYTPDDTNNYTTVAIKISVEVETLPTSGTEGEIAWNVSGDNLDTLTLLGGSMNDYEMGYAPWYAHKNTIKHVIVKDGVKNVGAYAFYGMSETEDITLANTVTKIGDGAFENCSDLTSINIPDSVSSIGEIAFSGCVSIRQLNIPDGLTKIENGTFKNCRSLSKMDIPNSVNYIGEDVFNGCDSITIIRVPFIGAERTENDSNKNFGYLFGSDNSNIPKSLTRVEITGKELADYIADNAFKGCGNIADIIIDGGRSIGNYAFKDCKNLKNLYLPKSVKNIGNEILSGCKKVETLVIPFVGINRLDENTETSVIGAFFGWDDSNLATGTRQYYNNNQSWHLYSIPSTLKNVSVLNQTNIPAGAFSESSIENVSIISGAVMNDYVFYNCTELKKVSLPSDMTNIGKNAFAECENLETINIPTKVKEIGEHAFYGASGLKDVTMPESIETIASDIFDSRISTFSDGGFSLMSDDELVITCAIDSAAYNYASARGIQTNVVSPEQLDKRGTATSVALLSDNSYLFDITDAYNMNGVLHVDLYDESETMINSRTQAVGDGSVEYREEFSREEMENVSFAKIYVASEDGNRISKTDEIISVAGGEIPTIPENDIKIVYRDGIVSFDGNSSLTTDATLIQAIYDNGKLQSAIMYPVSDIDDVIEVNSDFVKGTAKFMLWDSLNKMLPLAEAIVE